MPMAEEVVRRHKGRQLAQHNKMTTNGVHTWGKLASDASRLQLVDGESATKTNLGVVFYGGTVHQRTKLLCGTRSHTTGLLNARIVATLLAKRLVEPRLDETLPVLAEVGIRHDSVALSGHDGCYRMGGVNRLAACPESR